MTAVKLNPIDYLFTGVGSQPITFAFFYRPALDVKVLQNSLLRTIEYFPVVRSRLTQSAENEYQFLVTEAGLTFDVAESDDDFHETDPITRYITPVQTVGGEPMTKIKLTNTPHGSVLGVSISHALVDGFSYFHFLSSWARICRGEKIIPPSHFREFFSKFPLKNEKEITAQQLYTNCGLFYGERRQFSPSHQLHQEKIFLSNDVIKYNLLKINKEQPISCTANDVITAFLWKKYLPLWIDQNGNPDTFVTCPFDFRRVVPDFPKTYFGCALCFATVSLDLKNLLKSSPGELALLIRNAIHEIKEEYILHSLQTLDDFRQRYGLAELEKIHLRHPQAGIIVTNLTRMPISDLDFGIGGMKGFLSYAEISASAAILPATEGVDILLTHPQKVGK